MDKLSVCLVTVTYGDRASCLSQVLEGVAEQTYPVDAHVVVDNGSSYSVDNVLAQFGMVVRLIRFD